MGTKQEVCKIFDKPEVLEKLQEVKEKTKETGKEHAFTVCSDGRISNVEIGEATDVQPVVSKLYCTVYGSQVDMLLHSHPKGSDYHYNDEVYPYPSKGDIANYIVDPPKKGACIYGTDSDKVTCYSLSDKFIDKYRNRLIEFDSKIAKSYQQSVIGNPEKREEFETSAHIAERDKEYLKSSSYVNFMDSVKTTTAKYSLGKSSDDQWVDLCEIK